MNLEQSITLALVALALIISCLMIAAGVLCPGTAGSECVQRLGVWL